MSVSAATIACSPVSLNWRNGGGEHDGEPSATWGGGSRKVRPLSEGDGGLILISRCGRAQKVGKSLYIYI